MSKKNVEKNNVVLDNLKVSYLPVDDIKPNDYNPNRQSEHDFELLCKSIAADGFTQPIVVLKESKQIVDGEHRWRACKALGMKEVPCVLVDMTPEQMRIATLRHNRARGSEDASLAADVLKELAELGAIEYAQDELQLDATEVSRLLEDISGETADLMADVGDEQLGPRGEGLIDGDNSDTDADRRRAQERMLEDAKRNEERQMQAQDRAYRLVLLFTGKEAETVRAVLGTKKESMAQNILALCREQAELGAQNEEQANG